MACGPRPAFERMLWLNPHDNQGARFLLAAVRRGEEWESIESISDGF